MYFDSRPCAEAEISSSIRSKFDLPVPFCPITMFKSPGRQVTSLSDLKPFTSSCLIFIRRSPFDSGGVNSNLVTNTDASLIVAEIANHDPISVWNRKSSQTLRPFDHDDRSRLCKYLLQAEIVNLVRSARNAIQVEMVKPHPPFMPIHNRECRAVDFGGVNVQPRADAFGEDRLARAQIALKQKDRRFVDRLADVVSEIEGFFGGARDELSGWNR